jgi:uncharacterized repeat protein (TIGR01451 family)
LGDYTYEIRTENLGTDTATNVRIVDTIPAGITVRSISDGGRQEGNLIIWDVASLAPGKPNAITHTVTLSLNTLGTYSNTASSTADTYDPDPGNNNGSDATVETTVPLAPTDIQLDVEAPQTFTPGEEITFTFTVTNNSDTVDAENVVLDVPLPEGLEFVDTSCDTELPCGLGTVPPGESRVITVTYRVPDDFTPTAIEIEPAVDMSNPDSNEENNRPREPIEIPLFSGEPNLRLVKRITEVLRNGVRLAGVNFDGVVDDPSDGDDNAEGWGDLRGVVTIPSSIQLRSGDVVEYSLYLLSAGTAAVENVQLCDLIPENTTFLTDTYGTGQGMRLEFEAQDLRLTNGSDGDQGRYFPALNPVTSPCRNGNNPNGAVWLEGLTLEPEATATLRFRVVVD